MIPDDERCSQTVPDTWGHGFRLCSNRAGSTGVCGVHLRSNQRREERRRELDTKREVSNRARDAALEVVSRLRVLGVSANPHMTGDGYYYDGDVVCESEALGKLLDELSYHRRDRAE